MYKYIYIHIYSGERYLDLEPRILQGELVLFGRVLLRYPRHLRYRGTSLIRKRTTLGPCLRPMPQEYLAHRKTHTPLGPQ